MKTRKLITAATLAALVALGGTASAQLTWTAEVIPTEPTAKEKNPAPSIRVKITGEVLPGPDVWQTTVLKQVDTKMPGTKPYKAIPYHRSSETVGIVVLVEGHEYYFGNDKYRQAQDCKLKPGDPPPDPNKPCRVIKQSTGVYDIIKGTLETPGAKDEEIPTTISRAGPPGSKGALVVYSAGAEKKFEGDLKAFNAEKMGDQQSQSGKTTREFLEGLRMSADILRRIGTNRKALFIISDGFDAGSIEEIKAIKKRLDDDKVEVFPLYLEAGSEFIPDDAGTITRNKANMNALSTSGQRINVKDQAALAAAITEAITKINSRYTLVFPGQTIDPKTKVKAGFTWDEKEHEFKLTRGEEEIVNTKKDGEPIPMLLVTAPKWGQSAGGSLWWLWIVIPGGVLLLGIIIAAAGGKKAAPAPPPMVVAPAAPPPVQAAAPNPQKTMMVNISTGDGLPVVGWVVPISGEKQFQTFKLQYGETRVGTTSNSHIVLNDSYMSTDHAKIVMSPTGFTLMDNNSTNGTFANERRIQRHELVDNDMIMFGKTLCKFKTILGT